MIHGPHGNEMGWIDALGDVAQVMQVRTLGDDSLVKFVDKPVSHSVSPSDIDLGVATWPSVSLARESAEPVMAWGIPTHVSQLPVIDLLSGAEFAMDVPGGVQSGFPAAAQTSGCLSHVDNTTNRSMSPKEARAWQ